MRRGQGRPQRSLRQSLHRARLKQKVGGEHVEEGRAGEDPRVTIPVLKSQSPSSFGVTFAPEADAGTMEARIPSRAVAADNWVSSSPSNRATSLPVRERKGERKGEQERPWPETGGPLVSLHSCLCLPGPGHRPCPFLTPQAANLSWGQSRALS